MQAQTFAALSDMPAIPAMTTEAERMLYYRLVKENAQRGEVVELGAWLGASTAWIAAGMRDAGVDHRAQVYDRFQSKQAHIEKVRTWNADHGAQCEAPRPDAFDQFKANMGPLLEYVEPHQGEIVDLRWGEDPIAVLICDAPKRVPEISKVLTNFRAGLQPGAIMAWQDFCHFPSYEIPACLFRLVGKIGFLESVVPGTTLAFEVMSQWSEQDVSPAVLSVARWTPQEIERAWSYWLAGFVPAAKASLFRCGAAMFLCDIGRPQEAVETLEAVFVDDAPAILPKWQYLHRGRANLVKRYQPLFDFLADEGALS